MLIFHASNIWFGNILAFWHKKIRHEYLIYFKNDFFGQNVLITTDKKMSKGAKCPNTPNLYTTDNYVITCLRFINLRWIYLAFCLTSQVREVIVLQFNCWNSAVCCFELIKSFVRFCNSIHSFALKNVSLQSYFVEWKSNYWCIKFVTSS